jgi:hypothetical protein
MNLIYTYVFTNFTRKYIYMDTKLTLSLDKEIIEQAKRYAKKKNISLSKLIESYLNKVSSKERETPEISPLVKSLSGVISLSRDHDLKKSYGDFLAAKHKIK